LAARLSQVVREKEQAVQELREYEEEVERLQAQRDNLHEHCSQLKGEKETLLRTVIVCESVRCLPRQYSKAQVAAISSHARTLVHKLSVA